MIHLTRTASVAPGEFGNALAFAKQVNEHIATTHGVTLNLLVPVGGDPNRLAWTSTYPDLGALGDLHSKLLGDRKYGEILNDGAKSFIAGSVFDQIWRTL